LMEHMPGTLAEVAAIGYHGVEMVALKDGPPAKELRQRVDDAGLRLVSSHAAFAELRDRCEAVLDYHRELGHTDLVIGAVPAELRTSDAGWKEAIAIIERIAHQCRDAGFRLSMHNHAFELEETIEGVEAHHYVFSHIAPELLNAQLDTYFIEAVGKDPAAYVRKFKGRCPLLHIKDKAKDDDPDEQTQIGHGVIDWDAVFAAAQESGVEWYIVEQKRESVPGLRSVQMSLDYLRSRGMV